MLEHARYKFLVHLDGQGLSSRLDQLLPLGSLVFKEESEWGPRQGVAQPQAPHLRPSAPLPHLQAGTPHTITTCSSASRTLSLPGGLASRVSKFGGAEP